MAGARPRAGRDLSPTLFTGLAIASIGGPLALGGLYLPDAAGGGIASSGLVTALAILAFSAPIAVWRGYSREIASAGGLTAFVEAAAGRRVAIAQAAVWAVSYSLYLPFTIAFVVYDLLPDVFPGIGGLRPVLELGLPIALSALVVLRGRGTLILLAIAAAVQLALMLIVGAIALGHSAAPLDSFAPHGPASPLAKGAAGIGLLFICASLPLYAGGEVRGGTRTVRPALLLAFGLVAAYVLFLAFPMAGLPEGIRTAPIPGMAIASAYAGEPLATAVGVATAVSILCLVIAEFLALGWLAEHMIRIPARRALALIAVPFIAADAASLVDPEGFYTSLLRPSLIALFVSQIVVFAVYPLYRHRRGALTVGDVSASAVATALVGYGLYLALTGPLAS